MKKGVFFKGCIRSVSTRCLKSKHYEKLRSKKIRNLLIRCMLLVVMSLVQPTSATAQIETTQQPLFVLSTSVWASPVIPVCFEEDGFNYEKQWVREAIASSWEAASNVRFTGWDRCNNGTSSGLRVRFQDAFGFTLGLGNELSNKKNGLNLNTWVTVTCVPGWTRRRCVNSTAVHEFGHALGFAHEQNRDDRTISCTAPAQGSNGDTTVGPFDMMSVMNYCNPVRNGDSRLSRNDIAGVRAFYGWRDSSAYPLNSTDRKTDLMVWRPSEGNWYEFDRELHAGDVMQLGRDEDIPVRMDADGDGLKDLVVWRSFSPGHCSFSGPWYWQTKTCYPDREGDWRVINTSTGVVTSRQWGVRGDIPVPADYDGDGIDDYAVWRPSEGNWYVINSNSATVTVRGWGNPGDIPVPGDYDGDGRADFAVWRPSDGNWYVINSSTWAVTVRQWGSPAISQFPETTTMMVELILRYGVHRRATGM
jgi:FG-GAP-like repeat/Astacin (Peptidase family M12A)